MSGAAADSRILTLDVAKGIGIVLVVLGHNALFREGAHSLYESIYLFHMPLFFFLSGVTFRVGLPGEACVKRARALLVPYFVMGTVAVLMALKGGGLDAAVNELLGVFYGTGHTLRFVPLWFLPCLFVVSMAATLLFGVLPSTRPTLVSSVIVIVALAVGSLILVSQRFAIAPFVDAQGRPLGLPWSLDLLPFAFGLFVVGMLAARASLVHRCPQPWIVMLATAGVLAAAAASGASLDLNYRRMVSPFAVFVGIAAGIGMVLAAATLLSRVTVLAKVFGYLGSASLVIFVVHSPLQRRIVDSLGMNGLIGAAVSVSVTIGLIAAVDWFVLRRVGVIGWVVYAKKPSIAGRLRGRLGGGPAEPSAGPSAEPPGKPPEAPTEVPAEAGFAGPLPSRPAIEGFFTGSTKQ